MKKWGIEIPEKEKLQAIFDRFDVDKDGKISFNDL
jgi:Ca2+-binding EF-hand superfamily protein